MKYFLRGGTPTHYTINEIRKKHHISIRFLDIILPIRDPDRKLIYLANRKKYAVVYFISDQRHFNFYWQLIHATRHEKGK